MDLSVKIDALAEQWVEDSRVVKPSVVPTEVYHYTDSAGLFGMLSNNQIWLTDHRFLNDKTEFVHTRDILNQVLNEIESGDIDELTKDLLKRIRHYRDIKETDDAFVFSMSTHKDDLSQWRGYAREGMGFTIGFDGIALYNVAKPDKSPYSFSQVEYVKENQQDSLKRAFSDFLELLRTAEASDHNRKNISTAGRLFDWMASNRGAINKHSSFKSESEWRIVAYYDKGKEIIKTRVSGLRLIPYVALSPQAVGSKMPIKAIGIGPGFAGEEIVDAVRALAKQTGYNPDIYFADTPYRRL